MSERIPLDEARVLWRSALHDAEWDMENFSNGVRDGLFRVVFGLQTAVSRGVKPWEPEVEE